MRWVIVCCLGLTAACSPTQVSSKRVCHSGLELITDSVGLVLIDPMDHGFRKRVTADEARQICD